MSLGCENERLAVDLGAASDALAMERDRFARETQRLVAEAEALRDQLTARCREAQQLREAEVTLRSRHSEAETARQRAGDALAGEEARRQQLAARSVGRGSINGGGGRGGGVVGHPGHGSMFSPGFIDVCCFSAKFFYFFLCFFFFFFFLLTRG